MGDKPEGMSLDRINNDGNYEPSNCRWADATTQSRNTSKSTAIDRGLSFEKSSGKWSAYIAVNNRTLRIGTFSDIDDAISARKDAENKYWAEGKEPPPRGQMQKNNTTGYVGVAQDKRDGRWAAYYGSKPKRIHIGRFENAESAHLARVQYLEAHSIGAKE